MKKTWKQTNTYTYLIDDDDDQKGKSWSLPALPHLHHAQETQEEAVSVEEPFTKIICPHLRLHPQQVLEVIKDVLDAPERWSIGAAMF